MIAGQTKRALIVILICLINLNALLCSMALFNRSVKLTHRVRYFPQKQVERKTEFHEREQWT